MAGMIAGRTASEMPGLDIAEQRSWRNFLDSSLAVYARLNKVLSEEHRLSLADVRLLEALETSPTGSARMGDLAELLISLPSRVTRQIRRLESQGLVQRAASPEDGRAVLATITDAGRELIAKAMVTYAQGVRAYFLAQLSRPQMVALGENCRRVTLALPAATDAAKPGP
ncbi:MarR family winged helix-turn-helix transcriptional regulator [Mycolicibacterium palauense]|uniref:MarR family winged helix-turn-helix transcriptional regulator n=1 Tax=Mycolicibacterium palauense TaxID=2034511 RepID=UPI000BFED630|nr:MarR family transcriptional regulator [Mycolicibacterium palauense]